VVALVVMMHSNVTYSGMGMWYYIEGDPRRLAPLTAAWYEHGRFRHTLGLAR